MLPPPETPEEKQNREEWEGDKRVKKEGVDRVMEGLRLGEEKGREEWMDTIERRLMKLEAAPMTAPVVPSPPSPQQPQQQQEKGERKKRAKKQSRASAASTKNNALAAFVVKTHDIA